MTNLNYPNFGLDPVTGWGELREDAVYETLITGHDCDSRFLALDASGQLSIHLGYRWDFGSGPAVDTPDMVYASLAHDAFYELMVSGRLPWSERKKVDKYFRKLLEEAGMPWWRRVWVYYGVRWGYPLTKRLRGRGKSKASST